jgi:hypothetical protein
MVAAMFRWLIGAAVLGGCASTPQWQKAGATPEGVAADMKTCQLAAPYEPAVPAPRTKPGMGGGFDAAFEREANRMRKDERHVAECMRAKGYSESSR